MGHGGYKILTEVQSNLPSKYLCYLYSVRKCRSKVNIPLPSGCVFRRVNSEPGIRAVFSAQKCTVDNSRIPDGSSRTVFLSLSASITLKSLLHRRKSF